MVNGINYSLKEEALMESLSMLWPEIWVLLIRNSHLFSVSEMNCSPKANDEMKDFMRQIWVPSFVVPGRVSDKVV